MKQQQPVVVEWVVYKTLPQESGVQILLGANYHTVHFLFLHDVHLMLSVAVVSGLGNKNTL